MFQSPENLRGKSVDRFDFDSKLLFQGIFVKYWVDDFYVGLFCCEEYQRLCAKRG